MTQSFIWDFTLRPSVTFVTKASNEKQTVIMNLNSGTCKFQLIMAALVCQSVTGNNWECAALIIQSLSSHDGQHLLLSLWSTMLIKRVWQKIDQPGDDSLRTGSPRDLGWGLLAGYGTRECEPQGSRQFQSCMIIMRAHTSSKLPLSTIKGSTRECKWVIGTVCRSRLMALTLRFT